MNLIIIGANDGIAICVEKYRWKDRERQRGRDGDMFVMSGAEHCLMATTELRNCGNK